MDVYDRSYNDDNKNLLSKAELNRMAKFYFCSCELSDQITGRCFTTINKRWNGGRVIRPRSRFFNSP